VVAAGNAPVRLDPVGEGSLTEFLLGAVEVAEVTRIQPLHKGRGLDIEDPYRRKASIHRRSADAVAQNVDRLVAALGSLATAEPVAVAGGEASTPPA
jgi:hypothetical protein